MKRDVKHTPNQLWLKSIHWLVFSNIWVSCSVFSFTLYTHLLFDISKGFEYSLLAGFTTLFAYNFQRLLKLHNYNEHKSYRHHWIEENQKTILALTYVSALLSFTLAYRVLTLATILYSIPFILFVLLYAYSSDRIKAIREIPFTKNIIIAIVWTWVIAAMPLLLNNFQITYFEFTYIALVFLLVFALCIPFDIRDIKLDEGKVRTIATQYGIKTARAISEVILITLGMVAFYFTFYNIGLVAYISVIVVLNTKKNTNELYYTGLIDGLFMLIGFSSMIDFY